MEESTVTADPQLNLPPSMHLDSSTPSRNIDRMINSNHRRSPSTTIYSDRFIPSRTGSNFALFDIPTATPSSSGDGKDMDGSGTYERLLRAALFGPENPQKKEFSVPDRIFRYKTETKRSLHSLSPFGFHDVGPEVNHSPVKAPRKVPRSPHKVLDAPALQDDFYLNLVDWSSHNVLAVGLTNCVYLWNACSSKVTKLCDLGIDDSVCSVGWAQRGTHLAVGTNYGKVEIWDASRCKRVRTMDGHRLRVGALAWSASLLSSGSRDKSKLLPTTSCCCCYCCPSRPKPIQKFTCQDALILLQKCANFNQLKLIHAKIIRQGLSHSHDQLLVRNLLRLCSSYAQLDYATHVFHQIKQPSSFTWNLMIRSLATNAKSKQALLLYNSMLSQGYPPDKFTFPFVVKACIASFANHKGKEVHGLAIKTGFYARDLFVQNTLMDLYFKCGDADSGRMVFDKMRVRNVVSWTTMLTGLVACGDLDAARWVFDQMPTRNVVSWSAMVNAYVTNQQPQEAFQLFHRMQIDNVRPNEFTLVSLLKACTHLDSLELGTWIHDFAINAGFQLGVFLGTALIDMYSKCGSLEYARLVFDKMQVRNLATWNSMITSLGVHGYGEEALALFAQMEMANVQPDAITFVGVLSACVHTNNIDEGYRYFGYMTDRYGITPILEHYSCMIELYSRADMLDEVHKLVKSMPVKLNDDSVVALIKPSISKGVTDMEGATV